MYNSVTVMQIKVGFIYWWKSVQNVFWYTVKNCPYFNIISIYLKVCQVCYRVEKIKIHYIRSLQRGINFSLQLMVAEKNGTIRFYDLVTQQAILSLECEQKPLMSADWCLKNNLKIGAVAGSDWLIWDVTRSRYFSTREVSLFSS